MRTSLTPPASSMASGKDSIALLPIGSSALGVAGEFSGYKRLPVSLASRTAWKASGMTNRPLLQNRAQVSPSLTTSRDTLNTDDPAYRGTASTCCSASIRGSVAPRMLSLPRCPQRCARSAGVAPQFSRPSVLLLTRIWLAWEGAVHIIAAAAVAPLTQRRSPRAGAAA